MLPAVLKCAVCDGLVGAHESCYGPLVFRLLEPPYERVCHACAASNPDFTTLTLSVLIPRPIKKGDDDEP